MNTFTKLTLMLLLGIGLVPSLATAQSFSPFYPAAPTTGGAFGLTTDSDGNLYIAFNNNGAIEVVSDEGNHVGTINDDDGCSLGSPRGIALDESGTTLYVADHDGNAIVAVSDPAGTPSCTTLDAGPLNDPFAVAVHGTTLYISEWADGTEGSVKAVDLSSPSGATDIITGLTGPTGLEVDASGNIYVATRENVIVKYDASTSTSSPFATLLDHGGDYGPLFLAFGPLIPTDPDADNPFSDSQMLYLTSFKERGYSGYIDYVEQNGDVNPVPGPTGNAFTGLAFNELGSMFYVELVGATEYRVNRSDVAFPALPVELTAFDAIVDQGRARLVWTTASEINNAGFEIQRRFGNAFETVGFVQGNGTTIEAQSYGYEVSNLEPGRYVFRLKQVDYDGTFAYSGEVEVSIELAESYHLSAAYPNPFNPQTQFELSLAQDQQVRVAVYDALGRQVALLHDGSLRADQAHRFTFESANLPSGMYLIQVRAEFFNSAQPITLLK